MEDNIAWCLFEKFMLHGSTVFTVPEFGMFAPISSHHPLTLHYRESIRGIPSVLLSIYTDERAERVKEQRQDGSDPLWRLEHWYDDTKGSKGCEINYSLHPTAQSPARALFSEDGKFAPWTTLVGQINLEALHLLDEISFEPNSFWLPARLVKERGSRRTLVAA